ncbi:hypothetical protein NDU88_000767 [Pleurodeles waltl]|uniref:Uncharacterized protein n=1 Tax=Pleurodeles waltl TaxID=8319 RepID=A0AAV7U4Y3_PLEWA|nr:hypothetical protein NDU88_000767 [Pleurodeles waltl]
MRQGEGRALCLRGVAFWEAAEGFRAGALGRSGRSAPHLLRGVAACPSRTALDGAVAREPAGTGRLRGVEAAGPRRSLSGGRRGCLPAGTGGDAPRNGRSELLGKMRWVEEEAGDGTRVPGPPWGGGFPGPGATRPLSTLVGPLGGRKLPGCLAFPLPGRAFRETAGPRVGRSLAGLEALCLKQQPRLAKQSIPKRTKCAQSIGVRCWLDPGRQSALWAASFGGETRRTRVRGGGRATRALGARSRTTGPPDHEGVRRTLSLVIRRKIWALPGSWCAPGDGGDRRRERTRPPGALAGQEGANEPSSGLPGQPGHLDAP